MATPADEHPHVWATVSGVIGYLPDHPQPTKTAQLHTAFSRLAASSPLPGLRALEFHRRPGVPPISEELDQIVQTMSLFDAGAFDVRGWHFPAFASKASAMLRDLAASQLPPEQLPEVERAGHELAGLLGA